MAMTEFKYQQSLAVVLNQIKAHASALGVNQALLADRAGLHTNTVNNIFRGWTKRPQFRTILRLASAVGMDLELVSKIRKAKGRRAS